MSGALALWMHSIKRVRVLIVVMGALLALFQVLITLVARSIERSDAFGQLQSLMPDFVRQLMGPAAAGVMSFSGIVCVGYFHLAVMGFLIGVMVALATEPASEIETGFMDLILSRPLARHWVITRSVGMVLTCAIFLLLMMWTGTWAALRWLAPPEAIQPEPGLIRSLVLNLGILMFCWGGIALAVSSVSRRRSVAGSLVGVTALATYLLDYIARLWEPAEKIAWISPFRYYSPLDLLTGKTLPPDHIQVLAGIAVVGTGIAYLCFSRRDI